MSQNRVSKEDAEEFTQSIGQIASGGYRLIILSDKLGVPEALGFKSLRDWVQEKLGGYIRYSVEDRRKIVEELLANGEKQVRIADALGISGSVVSTDKAALGLPKRKRRKYPKTNNPEEESGANLQRVADDGLELLVWNKVKNRLLPVWLELLEMLDPDEREVLPWAILNHANVSSANHENA